MSDSGTRRHGSRPQAAHAASIGLAALCLMCGPLRVSAQIEWQLGVSPVEAAPKSFPTAAIRLRNTGRTPAAISVCAEAEAPLRSVSSKTTALTLGPGEETTTLHTLYVPPGAPGGTSSGLRVTVNGETRACPLRIREIAAFKARALSVNTRFLPPGERAEYKVRVENFGNVALDCDLKTTTSPQSGRSRAFPDHLQLAPGAVAEARVEVETAADMLDFTTLVTVVEVKAPAATDGRQSEFLYFQTEVFPKETPVVLSQLFETLKGSLRVGVGAGQGNADRGTAGDAVFREELSLEGLIAEGTRLEFVESATLPSETRGSASSSALSSLPGGSLRDFFRLEISHARFDLAAGEISTAPPRLLSPRETGDGGRVAWRPTPDWQVEAFGERNRLTLTDKTIFGAALTRLTRTGPLEFWKIGTLSKRDDVGPQGRNWDATALETGWKLPVAIPLRAELSGAAGRSEEGSGGAWLAGLHYNRTLRGEPDTSPLKAGAEFATGSKEFPGTQNGREDRWAYATLRLSAQPLFSEAYLDFNDSRYQVVPRVEKTLAEELDALPSFLHTSQSRLLSTGVRWKNPPETRSWLPSGGLEYQESELFNKDNFFDRSQEKSIALTLQPFERWQTRDTARQWDLNLLARGGHEDHKQGLEPATSSRFITLGTDLNWSQPAPRWLDRVDGPGTWAVNVSARHTSNLENDPQAYNRTGLSASAGSVWQTRNWNARATASVYRYESEGLSLRASATITRRVAPGWWAGIEAAFVHRGASRRGADLPDESAVLLTFRHDFEVAVPWLPRRGQSAGLVFNDLNNDGVRDVDEPGLPGVKVSLGRSLALTGPDGRFTLPAMEGGVYLLAITPPADAPLNQSETRAVDKVTLTRGQVTPLALPMTRPTACEGRVRFAREKVAPQEVVEGVNALEEVTDLSGLEIVATDKAGCAHRSFTRADGFFALYLEPGAYELRFAAAGIKAQQSMTPDRLAIDVKRDRLEGLDFTLIEKVRRIRKTFTAQHR